MSPRTKEQYEKIRQEKKALIQEAALKLFATEGYHSSSISKIAKAAGTSKGLLYNYFDSKETLLQEVLLEGIHELTLHFDPNHDGNLTQEEAEYYVRSTFQLMKENLSYWKLYFSLLTQPQVLDFAMEHLLSMVGPIMEITNNYFKSKGVKNPEAHTRTFIAILDGVGLHYLIDTENFPLDDVIDLLIEKFIH